jgi:DNA-binding response OmpR family regulator
MISHPQGSVEAMETGGVDQRVITVGNLSLNLNTFETLVDGWPVELSYNEFELLSVLAGDQDRILPYDVIVHRLWSENGHGSLRHLHVIVHRLRQKLAGLKSYELRTVRGRGYGLIQARNGKARQEGDIA